MTTTIERGIRRKPGRTGLEAHVMVGGRMVTKYFIATTPIETIREWREAMKLTRPRSCSSYLPTVPMPPRVSAGGYVYFLQMQAFVKIGRAMDVAQRIEELQTAHPETLRLVAYVHATQPGRIEATLHQTYQNCRVRGEWFALTEDLVRLIRKHASIVALNRGTDIAPLESTV
jgi:hypothetical protein